MNGYPIEIDQNILLFFDKMPGALPLYEAVQGMICAEFDSVRIKVQKTQISFSNKYLFACVSLPFRRRKGWPELCIILTFGLNRRLDDPRVAVAVEPYPGRWTHHVIIQNEDEVDGQILEWLKEAYQFALVK